MRNCARLVSSALSSNGTAAIMRCQGLSPTRRRASLHGEWDLKLTEGLIRLRIDQRGGERQAVALFDVVQLGEVEETRDLNVSTLNTG
jgi:hypothetical protein